MSTELKSHTDRVTLTRFFGGSDRGVCVQVTAGRGVGGDYVQLTRAQAASLALDLLDFATGRETEDFEQKEGDVTPLFDAVRHILDRHLDRHYNQYDELFDHES